MECAMSVADFKNLSPFIQHFCQILVLTEILDFMQIICMRIDCKTYCFLTKTEVKRILV